MPTTLQTVTVASVSGSIVNVSVPGDRAGVTVPARNTTGIALTAGDKVTLRPVPRDLPQVTGRIG